VTTMILEGTAPVETSPHRMEHVRDPEPGPSQVHLRVSCCGISRADLQVIEDDLHQEKLPWFYQSPSCCVDEF
jgi:propanol-preferring alcohol dehydrogenase